MNHTICLALSLALAIPCVHGGTLSVDLGSASTFSVLAASAVTNTGNTVVGGAVGVWPGTSVTGFLPGIASGGVHMADAMAHLAGTDLVSAYSAASLETCGTTLTGQNLGGLTLTPGVYCFDSSAQLTGALTFDGLGDPNATFLIRTGSTLTTAPGASVAFTNAGAGRNLYWQVGSSATIDTNTAFSGSILANTSITLNTGATLLDGRALALNGAVTLDSNTITSAAAVPEPSTALCLAVSLSLLCLLRRKFRLAPGMHPAPRS